MLIIGVDDAGRGPLIGPMILAGVLIEEDKEDELKEAGAKDSKLLSHSERIRLAEIIKKKAISYHIVKVFPEELDASLASGINLNTLEAIKIAEVIDALNTKKQKIHVIVDCPSNNINAWRSVLVSHIKSKKNLDVICEHKADFNHPSVSAASILAKVAREEEVEKIKKEFGDIGSGYPSDPTTKEFLKKKGKEFANSGIFRKSWATWKDLFPVKQQKTLTDY